MKCARMFIVSLLVRHSFELCDNVCNRRRNKTRLFGYFRKESVTYYGKNAIKFEELLLRYVTRVLSCKHPAVDVCLYIHALS